MEPWKDFEKYIILLSGIEELIFDEIPPSLLKAVVSNMTQLCRLECYFVSTACTVPDIWNTPCEIELAPFRVLDRLVELRIGSGSTIILKSGVNFVMPYLPNLRHLALTGFNFHSHVNLETLLQLNELISLELGDCVNVEPEIYGLLETLTKLKNLRLENGGSINDIKLSEALSKIEGLEVLELMNFKISTSLAECFKKLKQLINVNIWPDSSEKSDLVYQNLFNAMLSLQNVKYVCWGIISEGDSAPEVLEMRYNANSNKNDELTLEELFEKLVVIFPGCLVELKFVPKISWRKFCVTRK